MNTATLADRASPSSTAASPSTWARLLRGRSAFDWVFALLVVAGAAYALHRYGPHLDVYETGILLGAVPSLIALGWYWGPIRPLTLAVGAAALTAIGLYSQVQDGFGADLSRADQVFVLKYLLSSQSAILWMGVLFFMSTAFYWLGLLARSGVAQGIGSKLAWGGVFMALTGTMVRWFESHQIAPDIGHIPVSNLYEVFVLFSWMTTLFWLYYEARFASRDRAVRSVGAFVMLVVSAAVGFLWWYTVSRGAQEIQPLVPALQSWWMKVHVPANFVGYGTFAMSAMVALAYLLKTASTRSLVIGLVAVPAAVCAVIAAFWGLGDLPAQAQDGLARALRLAGGLTLFFAACVLLRPRLADRLPPAELLDDVMYKAIAVGFAFFTIATILGALWAAEAWGGYWSWDPKETWALIVWLNYAAWLHMRLMKGLRGAVACWWALVGLLVTTFAFLGVNMFLSGLHSYGEL
ncbi:MAG: c-type cytochrome biogenesis protein CcsB [Burkholderiales bacterium]|nr:c-type cytochrome biogenesis protein CcsB [Burkholderiales bacterium]